MRAPEQTSYNLGSETTKAHSDAPKPPNPASDPPATVDTICEVEAAAPEEAAEPLKELEKKQ